MDNQDVIDNVVKKLGKLTHVSEESVTQAVEAIRLMAKNEAIIMVDDFIGALAKSGKQGQVLTRGEGLIMEWKDPTPCRCGGE